jgi:hypothetical protein
MRELVRQTDYSEIMAMEQELMAEGIAARMKSDGSPAQRRL